LETWKPVVGYEGLYEVSDRGNVRSMGRITAGRRLRGRTLRPGRWKGGHLFVVLWKDGQARNRAVHSLVAEAFLGPRPEGHEVCHTDGDSTNNRPENLRYDTRKGNVADMVKHGRLVRGSRHPNAKLTEADVVEIRRAYADRRSTQAELAARYGVSQNVISRIVRWRMWAG